MKDFLIDIKIIGRYLADYKKEVYKISFLALISSVILAVIPYLYGRIVDIVQIQPSNLTLIFNILGVWLLVNLFGVVLNLIVEQKGGFIGVDMHNDLICKAASHLIRLPLSFHKEKKIGEIYSRIERASDYILRIADQILFWTLPQFLTAFVGLFVLFLVDWKLALGAAIIFFGYIFITIYKTGSIVETHKKLNKLFEEVSGNLYDSVLNAQAIKSNAAENFQEKRTEKDYKVKTGPVFKNFMNQWHFLHLWQQIFYVTGFVCLFSMAILLLRINSITVGELIMFFGYLNLVHNPLRGLAWHWHLFRTGMTTIKRVEGLLEIEPEDYKEKGKILEEIKGKVKFDNVSFGYKEKQLVLKNINFIAKPGQKIALVGESGEGKTTFVDLISLYFKPTHGKILIDDVDITKLNLRFLRENIAYVPQEIVLFNDTIKNNIKFGNPRASEEQIVEAAKFANAHDFIEKFSKKYEQLVGERGIKLSTGQKQRIAIARAIIRDPKILILDEATASLDSKTEKLVQEALEKLTKSRTTFIIAHRLSTIKAADKILVLKSKKITEEGTHQELIKKKGIYYDFHSLQFETDF
ncbi:MAG: ABC transporter ATP-binding protein [Candidatus Nealsonbacteria bacterium]